jgi:mono/diheme cytochrome c family protein
MTLRGTTVIAILLLLIGGALYSRADEYGPAPNSSGPLFTYESLQTLIQSKKITSVDQLIPDLPSDCLSHSVLVYKSRSIQPGTVTDPRVILYCDDGKLLLAYSGNKTLANGNSLEVIHFDDSTKKFNFTEVTFKPNHPQYAKNPEVCLHCHGADRPHPNWDAYNLWPGVFASAEGEIYVGSKEDHEFTAFLLAHKGKTDRYSPLIGLESLVDIKSLKPGQGYQPVADVVMQEFNAMISKLNFDWIMKTIAASPTFPEYKYAILGALSNCDGIEGFIPSSENARILSQAHITLDQIIQQTDAAQKQYILDKFSRQGGADLVPGETNKYKDHGSYVNFDRHGVNGYAAAFEAPTAKFRYLMMSQGMDIDEWSLPFDGKNYSFDDGGYGLFNLVARLEEQMTKSDPDLAPYFSIQSDHYGTGTTYEYEGGRIMTTLAPKPGLCDLLKAKSLAAFKGFQANSQSCFMEPGAAPLSSANSSVIEVGYGAAHSYAQRGEDILRNTCMVCHAQGADGAPKLPLTQELGLAAALSDNQHFLLHEIDKRISATDPTYKMPPNEDLSASDRRALEDYIHSLSP